MEVEVSTSKSWRSASRGGAVAAWAAALLIALPHGAAAQTDGPAPAATAPASAASALKPDPAFAQFPRYVGLLGKRRIVMRLGPKNDYPTGVHGEYQFTDTGEVILIAGDREGNTLEAEESNDGTHITGNWDGTFAGDGTLSGSRMDADDTHPVDFTLTPLAAGQPVPAVSAAPAPTPAGHAVNGVSNLQTGE